VKRNRDSCSFKREKQARFSLQDAEDKKIGSLKRENSKHIQVVKQNTMLQTGGSDLSFWKFKFSPF
jgi:hypothetical protein